MNTLSESEKFNRKMLAEQQKRMRPGECLKYINVLLPVEILQFRYGSQIETNLRTLGVNLIRQATATNPGIISWTRNVQQNLVQHGGQLSMNNKTIDEEQILLIMFSTELGALIKSNTLLNHVQTIQKSYPSKQMCLVVCGLSEYMHANNHQWMDPIKVEKALTRLQICASIGHRLVDTAADLAVTVSQFTKSVAELPYKKQQSANINDQHFYMENDNKDCVAVRGTAGLAKLWQHQLIKLPLATLETAEAIIGEYPMPRLLLNEYANTPNGADLLANIPVRRAGGPLTSVRKIGPEMSRRVCELYTNDDPDHVL